MSYTAWSVSFGEQPSASKWNILGANDASFNDGTGIGTGAITSAKILDGTIATGDIANLAITTALIAANAVTSAKVDSTVAQITAGDYKIQSGVATGSAGATVTVNFSPAFSATPLVFCTFVVTSSGSGFVAVQSQSSTQFTFDTLQDWSTRKAGNCNWLAIGH